MTEALGGWLFATRIGRHAGAALIATVTLGAGVALGSSHHIWSPFTPQAPPAAGTHVWVATNGNDTTCARDQQALPCLTLDRARDIAQCGDNVEVAAGSYGSQNMAGPVNGCTANPVTFTVPTGTATVSALTMNSPGTTLDGLEGTAAVVNINESCTSCSLLNGAWRGFEVSGADYVLLDGNTFNGQSSYGRNHIRDSAPQSASSPVVGITVSNNIIENYCCDGAHEEAIYTAGDVRDGYIYNNQFPHNTTNADGTGHLFFSWCGHAQGDVVGCASPSLGTYPFNWCVTGNTFGDGPPFYAIQARPEIPNAQAIRIDTNQPYDPSLAGLYGPNYNPEPVQLVSSCTRPAGAPPPAS